MQTLGSTLKSARELQPFTLRQVEEATGISNAYLSMLENDKIKKPSAMVLYKLSSFYKISLDALLYAAGIIKDPPSPNSGVESALLSGVGEVTPEEEKMLLFYLQFLRHKAKHKPAKLPPLP